MTFCANELSSLSTDIYIYIYIFIRIKQEKRKKNTLANYERKKTKQKKKDEIAFVVIWFVRYSICIFVARISPVDVV